MRYTTMNSPLGTILIARNDEGITAIQFETERRPSPPAEWEHDASALADAVDQLGEYFAGRRTRFDLPLAPGGTAFQRTVWDALVAIPFGETRSYGEIATEIGAPSASRAVGAANGRNPIAIVIPCHRVIGASGSLTGYAGGLAIKRALLELEWASGRSAQNFRDPAFLGIVDPENDSVYIPLKKGSNELLLAVSELGGGWGFICRDMGGTSLMAGKATPESCSRRVAAKDR